MALDDMQFINTPVSKHYMLSVQVVSDEVECLSLITQVLKYYPGIDRAWIARCLEPSAKADSIKTHPLVQAGQTLLKG